ncbi:MAG: glucose-6-phosphate dehydrogenase, partial [Nocardioides sp.]
EPTDFEAKSLRIEKEKVLGAISLPRRLDLNTARGQYVAGWSGGVKVPGFHEEEGIPTRSTTETFAAIRLDVDNRRWAGVPFYLRHGKRLGRRVTEVAVVFKRAPHLPFHASATEELTQNALVVRVQPDEGLTLRFGSKVPGTSMEIRDVTMDFAYGGSFTESSPEAYERLILDVLLGDPPLFPRHEEVELSWQILDPILDSWARQDERKKGKPEPYAAGTWGPASADAMLARDGRAWRRP